MSTWQKAKEKNARFDVEDKYLLGSRGKRVDEWQAISNIAVSTPTFLRLAPRI
jgi:hypothetical protein